MVSGRQVKCCCMEHIIPYPALVKFSSSNRDPSMYLVWWDGNLKGGSRGKVGRGGASGGVTVGVVDVWVFFSIHVMGVSMQPIMLELMCMWWRRYVGWRTKNMTAGGMEIQSWTYEQHGVGFYATEVIWERGCVGICDGIVWRVNEYLGFKV